MTLWCGNVFEAFALTLDDVVDCHDALDGPVGSVAELIRAVRRCPGTFSDPVTFVRDTLLASERGVDAPAEYWANAPEVHLDGLFAPFGCRVTVEWRREETRRIVLEDADGNEFRAKLTYPNTPLGQDNYPALLDAVNRDLLAGTGVELVVLEGPDRRWQFALGETAALDNLRGRYGKTIRLGGRQLLADHGPGAYVPDDGDEIPLPEWATDSDDGGAVGLSLGTASESFADLVERIDRAAGAFEAVDPEGDDCEGVERRAPATPSGDVANLFDDLSDVRPPSDVGGGTSGDSSVPVLGPGGGPSGREEDLDAIDELFRRIERDVTSRAPDDADDSADRTRCSDANATPADFERTIGAAEGDVQSPADGAEFEWLDERATASRG